MVNYNFQYFETIVLLTFHLSWNTITMVLWTKLWYYAENYGTSIHEGKNQELGNFDLE